MGGGGKLKVAVSCGWPWGCALTCLPLAYQPYAIPLATGGKEQPGPASPRGEPAAAAPIIREGGREGWSQPHHMPFTLLKEVECHSPGCPLGPKGQNH